MLTTAISLSSGPLITSTEDEEDTDDWLNVDVQYFDDILEKTMGASRNKVQSAMDVDQPKDARTEEDSIANEQASRLKDFAAKVENFVEGQGDIEGAKFEE